MAQAAVKKTRQTYADYLETPEGGGYQLIEGSIVRSPSPSTRHQMISVDLAFELTKCARERNLGTVLVAPMDVYFDDETTVQPDLMLISKSRADIIEERFIRGTPDLVVEIVSETSAHQDMVLKKRLYAHFGVKEYWIVIPEEEAIDVYVLHDNAYDLRVRFRKTDTAESATVPGITIDMANVF
ncbi:MAG: Uma2 family endonuclease [Deltaproteobacteria bacterium]|nr:Uma2 family endonuclease [Deltaproteobacteria bacterium]